MIKFVAGRKSGEATGEAVPRDGQWWRNRMFSIESFETDYLGMPVAPHSGVAEGPKIVITTGKGK